MLVDAQRINSLSQESTKCPSPPFIHERDIIAYGSTTRFSAALTVLLAREKLSDNVIDDSNRLSRFLLGRIDPYGNKAIDILKELGFPVEEIDGLRTIQENIEKQTGMELDEMCAPSSLALSLIFRFTAHLSCNTGNRKELGKLGYEVGKVICVLDALKDLHADLNRNRYNPIASCFGINPGQQLPVIMYTDILAFLTSHLQSIRKSVQKLQVYRYRHPLENVFCVSFPHQIQKALDALSVNSEWEGNLGPPIDAQLCHCTRCTSIREQVNHWRSYFAEKASDLRPEWAAGILRKLMGYDDALSRPWVVGQLKKISTVYFAALPLFTLQPIQQNNPSCEDSCSEGCGGCCLTYMLLCPCSGEECAICCCMGSGNGYIGL